MLRRSNLEAIAAMQPSIRRDAPQRLARPQQPADDGWLGTRELPGYRAGDMIVRLHDLPKVDPEHLYVDLLLLDEGGRTQDNHSGPCAALARTQPLEERSRFVRIMAELIRHAGVEAPGLAAVGPPLAFIRERGVESDTLVIGTQLLDAACSETAVVKSLVDVLELSMGADEAERALHDIGAGLARLPTFGPFRPGNGDGLPAHVGYIVRAVGKSRARRYLRRATDFELVPKGEMFGV